MWHDKHGRPELTMSTEIMRGVVDWSAEEDAADGSTRGEDPSSEQGGDTAGKDQVDDDQADGGRGAVPRG